MPSIGRGACKRRLVGSETETPRFPLTRAVAFSLGSFDPIERTNPSSIAERRGDSSRTCSGYTRSNVSSDSDVTPQLAISGILRFSRRSGVRSTWFLCLSWRSWVLASCELRSDAQEGATTEHDGTNRFFYNLDTTNYFRVLLSMDTGR